MATAMAPWMASNGVAPVASTSEVREGLWSWRSSGKRGFKVGRASRVVVAAHAKGSGGRLRSGLCEDERRGFWNGGGRGGGWFAGEVQQWTALRFESQRSGSIVGGRRSRGGGRLCVRMAADYYSVLGVAKSATKQDIKSAYRKLARKVGGNGKKFLTFLQPNCVAMLAPALPFLGHKWFCTISTTTRSSIIPCRFVCLPILTILNLAI